LIALLFRNIYARGEISVELDNVNRRLDTIETRLQEHSNNPNIYRNRQITGVAVLVGGAATVLIVARLCLAGVAAVFATIGKEKSLGMAVGFLALLTMGGVKAVVADFFASLNSDNEEKEKLTQEKKRLTRSLAFLREDSEWAKQELLRELDPTDSFRVRLNNGDFV
jgi:hypothetical protein